MAAAARVMDPMVGRGQDQKEKCGMRKARVRDGPLEEEEGGGRKAGRV
jgi:hypothetical protein